VGGSEYDEENDSTKNSGDNDDDNSDHPTFQLHNINM